MTLSAPPAPKPRKAPAVWVGSGLLAAATLLVAWGAWQTLDAAPPALGRLPDFALTDQTGGAITSAALAGRPYVADFIFTSCAGQCMALTGRMARLSRDLPGHVRLVSVSVDPVRDTPQALAAYAEQNGADPERWRFLTGEPARVKALIQEGVTGSGPADDKAWRVLNARAQTIVHLSEVVLAKAKPEKGDAASWKTKVGEYTAMARSLAKAVGNKDMSAAKTELGKLTKNCEGCHKAHK